MAKTEVRVVEVVSELYEEERLGLWRIRDEVLGGERDVGIAEGILVASCK